MFEFSVSHDMKKINNNKNRIPTYLLANLLTLIINDMKFRPTLSSTLYRIICHR